MSKVLIIGCGGVAKLCRYSWRESAQIGVGMIARGEVALVVCNKGHEAGLFNGVAVGDPVVAVIMLVIISSLLCPIFLKLAFKGRRDRRGDCRRRERKRGSCRNGKRSVNYNIKRLYYSAGLCLRFFVQTISNN